METLTPAFLYPIEEIEPKLKEIQDYLQTSYASDEPNEVVDRAQMIEYYMTVSGKLLADGKYHKDKFTNSAIMGTLKEALTGNGWSATVINKKIEALAMDYNYLVNWAERTNRTCTHQLDFCRTLISKHKAEMQNRL